MNISPHTWHQLQEELYVAELVDTLTLMRWGFGGFWCTLPVGVTQLNQGSTEAISRSVISILKRMDVAVIRRVASQSEGESEEDSVRQIQQGSVWMKKRGWTRNWEESRRVKWPLYRFGPLSPALQTPVVVVVSDIECVHALMCLWSKDESIFNQYCFRLCFQHYHCSYQSCILVYKFLKNSFDCSYPSFASFDLDS